MAGYQFFHVECYSRSGSKQTITRTKAKSGDTPAAAKSKTYERWSIDEIADEALRADGACSHVENPQPPNVIFGAGVRQAMADAHRWAEDMRDAQGRKLRKDGLCVLAGVISLPRERLADWPAFRDEAVNWLREKYGDRLRCAVEHLDEAHPHLHFYCVPLAGERFEALHEGKAAVARAKAAGEPKGAQNAVYKAAMRSVQDDFWQQMAVRYGLARKGPGRRRLGRAEWMQEQAQAEVTATLLSALKTRWEGAMERLKGFREQAMADALQAADSALQGAYGKLQTLLREVIAREKAVSAQEADLRARETTFFNERQAFLSDLETERGNLEYDRGKLASWAKEHGAGPPPKPVSAPAPQP